MQISTLHYTVLTFFVKGYFHWTNLLYIAILKQVLLLSFPALPMVLLRSGWTMSTVVDLKPDSLTVLLIHWEATIAYTLKMLE